MARGPGLRIRLSRIRGVTPKGVLGRALFLPCVIGDFTHTEEFRHTDFETPGGEFSLPGTGDAGARMLRPVDLEGLAVDYDTSWLTGGWTDPDEVLSQLNRIGRARAPFELLATLSLTRPPQLRMRATLRSKEWTLRPGEADTRYFKLPIKEWRDPSIERRRLGERGGLPTTHRLTSTDTLYDLADRYYRSEPKWRDIARANGLASWPPSGYIWLSPRFKVGDRVKIPKPSGRLDTGRASSVAAEGRL